MKNKGAAEKKKRRAEGRERNFIIPANSWQIRLFGADSTASAKVSALRTLIAMRWLAVFDEETRRPMVSQLSAACLL